MPATRRESSADSAARFLALRSGRPMPARTGVVRTATSDAADHLLRWMSAVDQLAGVAPPGRVLVDFAEPTLRLIHEVLLDAMHANVESGNRGALLMIADQMVAQALGMPPCDEPPLTDREVTR